MAQLTDSPAPPDSEGTSSAIASDPPSPGDKCVSIIFNPVSGKSDPVQRQKAISSALAQHGYTCQFLDTTPEYGAKEAAQKAVEEGVDLIAVSGGDGTVMEVLSALVGTEVPVAVLPAGTGNLLSVNLGIPLTVPAAVEVALSGQPFFLDLAVTSEGRHFAIMGGLGLDGQVIEDADRAAKDRFGVLAYIGATLKNLARRRAPVMITLDDGTPLRRRAKTVVIANMGKITGGMEAIPTASPTDGLLDIGVIKARTLGQGLRLLGYALLGRAQDAPDLEVYQARRVHLRTEQPQPVQFDGEAGGHVQELSVEIVPRAVCVLLPKDASAARDSQEPPAAVARKSAEQRLLLAVAVGVVGVMAGVVFWRLRRNKNKPGSR